jgi:hypothetical protein
MIVEPPLGGGCAHFAGLHMSNVVSQLINFLQIASQGTAVGNVHHAVLAMY